MHITDNEGKRIEVKDLDAAIKQAETFTEYKHEDSSFAGLDQKLKKYWSDVHQKLLKLKTPSQAK